jgi:hypothetical protein
VVERVKLSGSHGGEGLAEGSKSTIFTDPGGPLGDSLGSDVTRLTRESGKIEA